MSKLIIHNRTNLTDLEALSIVEEVVKEGKCSKSSRGEQYCWFVTFRNSKIQVATTRAKGRETYTFYVLEG